jgi:hypothetical protein
LTIGIAAAAYVVFCLGASRVTRAAKSRHRAEKARDRKDGR